MTDQEKPETVADADLDDVQGGALSREVSGFTGKGRSSGDIIATGNQTPGADGDGVWMQDWINNAKS